MALPCYDGDAGRLLLLSCIGARGVTPLVHTARTVYVLVIWRVMTALHAQYHHGMCVCGVKWQGTDPPVARSALAVTQHQPDHGGAG
jgi:hypothetical protein